MEIYKKSLDGTQVPYFFDIQKEFENLIIEKKFNSNQYETNMLEKSKELMYIIILLYLLTFIKNKK